MLIQGTFYKMNDGMIIQLMQIRENNLLLVKNIRNDKTSIITIAKFIKDVDCHKPIFKNYFNKTKFAINHNHKLIHSWTKITDTERKVLNV